MSEYRTIVCDRCGIEQKRENSDSWLGWHEEARVKLEGLTRLYSGFPDFRWAGSLCSTCAGEVDAAVRQLFGRATPPPPLNTEEAETK